MKSLESTVLEDEDKSLGTAITADKHKNVENTVVKRMEFEGYCARR
jgi:hypothetical protein